MYLSYFFIYFTLALFFSNINNIIFIFLSHLYIRHIMTYTEIKLGILGFSFACTTLVYELYNNI